MDAILLSQLTKGFADIKNDCLITQVTSDSRIVQANSVFLAIKGERVNGEDYALQAVEKGAKLVITENSISGLAQDKQCVVENVLDASIAMGKNFRAKYNLEVIGVTGSVGKTTTKDFIYTALSPFTKTVKSKGNQNNELGMPQTIFTFTNEDRYAILEMGMTHFNDVHKLSDAAKPKAAVITCIGVSHLLQMKTQENILKAKMEIVDGMQKDGILVLNGDDAFLSKVHTTHPENVFYFGIENQNADVVAKNVCKQDQQCSFEIHDKQNGVLSCTIPTIGNHNVLNALAAYTVVTRLGFEAKQTAKNLSAYQPSGMRQKLVKKDDILFIEDCYNASPDSMRAALNTLADVSSARKIAVLGDMLELGQDSKTMHQTVGQYAKQKMVDIMLCYGQEANYICQSFGKNAFHFEEKTALADFLIKNLQKGDTVLFKASRGMAFEEVIKQVYEKQERL